MDYKISSNEVFKDIAFQGSESGRIAVGDGISHFIYHRRWDGFSNFGLTFQSSYDPLVDSQQTGEDLYDTNTLGVDMNFDISGAAFETIESTISIIKSPGAKSRGSGVQQLSGYEGLGKGLGAGGAHLIYEVRSTGVSAAEAVAVTATEYRVAL